MTLFDIAHLRAGAAIAWAVVCLALAASVIRAWAGRERPGDTWRAVAFFCGLLFCLFPSRAMVAPGDDLTRKGLFVMSILLALYVLVLAWREWRAR